METKHKVTPATTTGKELYEALRSHGLLFEINRRVLHPLGFALAFSIDEDGNHYPFLAETTDPAGFVFSSEIMKSGKERIARTKEQYLNRDMRLAKYKEVVDPLTLVQLRGDRE